MFTILLVIRLPDVFTEERDEELLGARILAHEEPARDRAMLWRLTCPLALPVAVFSLWLLVDMTVNEPFAYEHKYEHRTNICRLCVPVNVSVRVECSTIIRCEIYRHK